MDNSTDDEYWVSLRDSDGMERQALLDYVTDALHPTGHPLFDLTAIIISGALFEYYLRALVRPQVDLSILEPANVAEPIPYATVLRLAGSLGVLPEHLRRPLLKFGHLRNQFAHDIKRRLGDEDIAPLDKSLTDPMRKELETHKREMMARNEKVTESRAYVQMFIAVLADELGAILRKRSDHER